MTEEEKLPSKFPAIVIEGDKALTIIYIDAFKRVAIRQFYFEIKEGKIIWENADVWLEDEEIENFKNAINEIVTPR